MWSNPHRCGVQIPETIDGSPGFLFRLASDWVYHARSIAQAAVGSYPTFSPLLPGRSGLFSVALAVNLPLRKPPCFHGESYPMMSGLSSRRQTCSKRMTASRKILKVKKYSEDLKIRDECTSPVADLPLHIDNSSALITLGDLFFNKHGRDHIIGYP